MACPRSIGDLLCPEDAFRDTAFPCPRQDVYSIDMKPTGTSTLLDARTILKRVGVAEGMTIADLGCGGAGHFVFPASAMVGDSGHVYSADIIKSIIDTIEARVREHNITNITPVWTDLEVYGAAKAIADTSLDLALLLNTLFQARERQRMMAEASRMIKKGGRLLVAEWAMTSVPVGPAIDLRIAPDEVRRLASGHHLREVDAFDPGPYHYAIVFEKE